MNEDSQTERYGRDTVDIDSRSLLGANHFSAIFPAKPWRSGAFPPSVAVLFSTFVTLKAIGGFPDAFPLLSVSYRYVDEGRATIKEAY